MKKFFTVIGLFSLFSGSVAAKELSPEALQTIINIAKADTVDYLIEKAKAGDIDAVYQLGQRFETGNGVKQDIDTAIKMYFTAATKGHAGAQNRIGELFYNGQKYSDAVEWFKKAAAQGYSKALLNLGICYYTGNGVPQDFAKAAALNKQAKSADVNNPGASRNSNTVASWNYAGQKELPPALQNRFQAGKGRSGIVIDLNTRQVLWSKNPEQAVPVAALTKLMTAYLMLEHLDSNPDFWKTTLNVKANEIKVKDRSSVDIPARKLLEAMLIASNNGAAAALARGISGNVNDFVALMNSRAQELGLTSADFNSPNGYPQGKKRENCKASVADICHLCELLMNHQDQRILKFCGKKSSSVPFVGKVENTNHLLNPKKGIRPVKGIFGFKTGYSKAAGFCLAFGVERDGRTIIGCVTGFKSAADRDVFCRNLIEWAFKQ